VRAARGGTGSAGPGADQAVPAPKRGYRTIALIVAGAMFMELLDATILATALPTMARDFGVGAPAMSVRLIGS
jgi:hypothetical protein